MGKWTKRLAALTLSTSLVGSSFIPSYANAEITGKQTNFIQREMQKLQKQVNEKTPAFSEDTLVVKYVGKLETSIHKQAGTTLVKEIPELKYAIVKLKRGSELSQALKVYQKSKTVVSVGQSANFVKLSSNDPKVKDQYHLSLLNIEKAQKLGGKSSVKVAVIDSGIYNNHPDLKGQLLPSYNVLEPLNQGFADSHGTHVAGIIAGIKDNEIGGYGINPNAKILPIDVFNRGYGFTSDFTVAEAIMYAVDQGSKVINMSIGTSMPTPVVEDAVNYALSKNVTVVAAGGNESYGQLNYPAAIEGVIGVGSTNSKNELSSYSNYGSAQDLVAPGEAVYAPIFEPERNTSFRKMSGTSMASPVVAGVASLLLAKHPSLSPEKVEYILKHTAKDLGAKGYDTMFGYGLVDPVAALSFDIKKVPASVQSPKTEKEILEKAEPIQFTEEEQFTKEGKITKANEVHWFKVNVKIGEYIQTVLEGAERFDYQMKLNLYSPNGNQTIDVNQLKEGKTEGKLFKVPSDGTLVIGVKDSNGNYDDSGRNLSYYNLTINRLSELVDDGNTLENITNVEKLPFTTEGQPLTFTGEDGDEDYFKVKVEEPSILRVSTSGVPGVDSTINVYPAEAFFPPAPPTEEGQVPPSSEKMKSKSPEPMFAPVNNAGVSEGETLTFEAMPQMEYIISVTNKVNPYDMWFWDPTRVTNLLAEPSAIPYVVTMDSKTISSDEDGLPMIEESPEKLLETGAITSTSYAEKKIEQREESTEASDAAVPTEELDEEQKFIRTIMEQSRPYNIAETGTGFLQNGGDQDWFNFTPTQSGIFEWNLGGTLKDLPMMEILEIKEVEDEKGKKSLYFNPVARNYEYGWFDFTKKHKFFAGLTEGKNYLINIFPSGGNLSFNDYSFSSKFGYAYPEDKYEDNNDFEKAKDLTSSTVTANLANPYDTDIFYYKSKANELIGVSMEQGTLSKADSAKYPKELQQKIYGFVYVLEDTNRNRKLDEKEMGSEKAIFRGFEYGRSVGSFQAKKGKNYFVVASGFTETNEPLSVNPYKLTIQPAPTSQKDEDAKNVVKNNKPSEPLALKKVGSGGLGATGYLNPGVPYGDSDWYALNVDKTKKVKITLSAKSEIDGVISIYQNGKLLKKADYYPEADTETVLITLKKGIYHIKVSDKYGNASVSPYTLKVE